MDQHFLINSQMTDLLLDINTMLSQEQAIHKNVAVRFNWFSNIFPLRQSVDKIVEAWEGSLQPPPLQIPTSLPRTFQIS